MWEGPEETLTETQNAQPALYTHSLAAFRVLEAGLGAVSAAAGHSLGELSAHAAAGTGSFADGLRAVRRRGELMARAGQDAPGTMAAVLGMTVDEVVALCRKGQAEGHVVVPANLNADGQIVVSGSVAGISWIVDAAREAGAKRVVRLNVSGAFHSPLMAPAAKGLEEHLATVTMSDPRFPVLSNVTAEPVTAAGVVPALLVSQLTSPVRWKDSIERMVTDGVERFLEVGPGSVLAGPNRRNARDRETTAAGTADALRSLQDGRSA
jgi:[acyl-carrier-protein] S-malonyltransferase